MTEGVLRVNRQTYRGAIDVLYRENQCVLYGETRDVLCQNLTDVCFPLIRPRAFKDGHWDTIMFVDMSMETWGIEAMQLSLKHIFLETASTLSVFQALNIRL